jgi:hypothetical protein
LSPQGGAASAEINNLAIAVRNLKLAKDLPLVQFLPAIMNQLLYILQNYDRSRMSQQGELVRESFDLAAEAFDAVAHLVKTAQDNMETPRTRSEDLEVFVKHLFSVRGLSGKQPIGRCVCVEGTAIAHARACFTHTLIH